MMYPALLTAKSILPKASNASSTTDAISFGFVTSRIVALASNRFREKGLEGIGIAELMKQAGITVGGFYKHFGSRDDLVAQALGSAVGPWKGLMDAAASGGPPVTYDSLVDAYLSETHRNHPGTGCPK
jgi:TetR/AcrR family transcriptional repressor of nem operon